MNKKRQLIFIIKVGLNYAEDFKPKTLVNSPPLIPELIDSFGIHQIIASHTPKFQVFP